MENQSETQAPLENLFHALAKAQADCAGVEKASANQHHRYKYASAEDMIDAATQAMGPHGLALVCVSSIPDNAQVPRSMTVRYLMTHSSGESMQLGPYSLTVHPDKGRPMDKAISTCLTYLQAYCLRGILNIPRVEEGAERDAHDDQLIQAYASQREKDRKEREAVAKALHADRLATVKSKGRRAKDAATEFFAAAGVEPTSQNVIRFTVWSAGMGNWPSTNPEKQADMLDAAMLYLAAWAKDDEDDAMDKAHRFAKETGLAPEVDPNPPGFEDDGPAPDEAGA